MVGRRKGRFLLLLRRADELHLVERLLRRAKTRFVPLELARELAGIRRADSSSQMEIVMRFSMICVLLSISALHKKGQIPPI